MGFHVGSEKHKKPEECTPSQSSSLKAISKGFLSPGKVAAFKHKKEGKSFTEDTENNVVRQSRFCGETIGKGNFEKSKKQKNSQSVQKKNLEGIEKKKKNSAKEVDPADRFIKGVALTADMEEKSDDAVLKSEKQTEERKSVQEKPQQSREEKFSSKAKDGGADVVIQVLATSGLSNGKEIKE